MANNVEILNKEQICSVTIILKQTCKWYEYRERKKFLFFTIREEGFYYTYSITGDVYTKKEEIEENTRLFVDGKKVFCKPHIEIRMSDRTVSTLFFKDEEALNDYVDKVINLKETLKIEIK
jgi:hypothetical protein